MDESKTPNFDNWPEDLYARDATGGLITHDSKGNFIQRDANNAVIALVPSGTEPVKPVAPVMSFQSIPPVKLASAEFPPSLATPESIKKGEH